MIHQIPVELQPYIEIIEDVKPEENCGYRAISALLGRGEDSWPLVHHNLMRELFQ